MRSAQPTSPNSAAGRWWSHFRTVAEATVFHVDLTPHKAREADAYSWLDEEDRARWHRIQHPGTRRQFALCRATLRAVLSEQLGCGNDSLSFGYSEIDKPFALVEGRPAGISFNVSHSGDHGLVAIARGGRLGVDVEERVARPDLDGLISAVFGPDERAELAAAVGPDKLRLFFRYRTIKEALIKALGTGHTLDIASFEAPPNVRAGASTGLFRFPHLPDTPWRVYDLGNEDFAAALAHESHTVVC